MRSVLHLHEISEAPARAGPRAHERRNEECHEFQRSAILFKAAFLAPDHLPDSMAVYVVMRPSMYTHRIQERL
jgi:hypothetical protein